MRRRLALFVPALALAAAGSVPLAMALSGSAGASSIRNIGGSGATASQSGKSSNQTEPAADDHATHDRDKGEHLDLTCWDRDHSINQPASPSAAPATASTASSTTAAGPTAGPTVQPMIECVWHAATRKDFGGYKLERTSDPRPAKSMASGSTTPAAASTTTAEAGPKSATNPALTTVLQSSTRSTSMELDTSVSFNVEYTYQLQVLDSHGNVAVRSEPQTVIDRSPATDEARKDEAAPDEAARDEASRDEASRDCRTDHPDGSLAQADHRADAESEQCNQQSDTSGAQAADSRTAARR
jgi:hypothetical protein